MSQARGVIAGALLLAAAIGGLMAAMATRADAAPSVVVGPTETFTATVVGGTIAPMGLVVRFTLERPAMNNPAQLEHLTAESAQASLVIPGEILLITGNYDTEIKVFKATSMVSLGNVNPVQTQIAAVVSNDNADGDDNDNATGDDNGNDND